MVGDLPAQELKLSVRQRADELASAGTDSLGVGALPNARSGFYPIFVWPEFLQIGLEALGSAQ
jgi:hypothetical protein